MSLLYDELKKKKIINEDDSGNLSVNRTEEEMARLEQRREANRQRALEDRRANESSSIWDKVTSIANDLGNTGKNLFLGARSGAKQTLNYMENAISNNFSGYNTYRKNQFYASNKVDEGQKAKARAQESSMILKRAEQNMPEENKQTLQNLLNDKVETNLTRKTFQESINKDNEKIQENIENTNNGVIKKINELAPSIGQMGVGAVASAVNPALGVAYFTTSAGGSYIDDAKQRGMSDKQAFTYGTIMGAVEGATEEIGIGNFQKAGKVAKTLIGGGTKTALKEVSKQGIKEALKNYGIGIADNIMQEAIIEPIQELTAQTIGGKDKANWDNMGQRMLQSAFNGGLVSAIVGGVDVGVNSCVGLVDKINNGQQITQQEFETAVKDASKQLDVGQMVIDSVQQQINQYKDANTGEVLNENSQNALHQAEDIINQNRTQDLVPTQQNQVQNEQSNSIKELTRYNMEELKDSNINMAKTEDILKSKSNMGERSPQNIQALKEDIKESGFKEPIYISKETNKIVDGNHRLQIAKELGIDEVPVKYIDSSNDIDFVKNDWYNNLERRLNENGENKAEINGINATNQDESIDNNRSNEIINNQRNNATSNRLYREQQENNNRPSIETVYGENTSLGQEIKNNENSNQSSFNLAENHKQKQNEIIQKSNPMNKDLGEHTWINSAKDIKTYQEAIEEFGGVDNITPDFTVEDVKKAINTGKVTVYSSYPIEQGTFVTPSKMEAQSYAGNGQIYSKEVNLNDVAWIDEIQGQYAKVEENNARTDNLETKLPTREQILPTQQIMQEQNNVAQNENVEQIQPTKIEEKVNSYIESVKDNFKTNIDIDSKIVQQNNKIPINYKTQTEATVFKRAKDMFSTLQRKVFKNGDTDIYVDNSDIKESIHHTLKDNTQKKLLNENLAVYSQLDKIIENAVQISEDVENKGRDKFSDWKYYASNANIDGSPYVVEFDTTNKDGQRHFRLERVYKLNGADVATDSSNNMTPRFECNNCSY